MTKMRILKEFQEFAVKGNAIDLAVGVIIGAAFGKVVDSIVNDLLMPPLGKLSGGIDFTNKFILMSEGTKAPGPYETLKAAKEAGAVTINYGQFINVGISFLMVAFAVFMLVKGINKLRAAKAAEPAPSPAPEPTIEEKLLTEIRDLLAQKS